MNTPKRPPSPKWYNMPEPAPGDAPRRPAAVHSPQSPKPQPTSTGAFTHERLHALGYPVVPPVRVLVQEMTALAQEYKDSRIALKRVRTPTGLVLPGPSWARVFPELLADQLPPLADYFVEKLRGNAGTPWSRLLCRVASRYLRITVLVVLWITGILKPETPAGLLVIALAAMPFIAAFALVQRRRSCWPLLPKALVEISQDKMADLMASALTARDVLLAMAAVQHDPRRANPEPRWRSAAWAGGLIVIAVLAWLAPTEFVFFLILVLQFPGLVHHFRGGSILTSTMNKSYHFSFSEVSEDVRDLVQDAGGELYLNLHEMPAAVGRYNYQMLGNRPRLHGLVMPLNSQVIEETQLRQAAAEFEFFYNRRMERLRDSLAKSRADD